MILYSKFNQNRKAIYQLITIIKREKHRTVVYKIPQSESSIPHIQNIYKNYKKIKTNKFVPSCIPSHLSNNKISLNYIKNVSLENILRQSVIKTDKNTFLTTLNNFVKLLKKNHILHQIPSPQFIKFFGKPYQSNKKLDCLSFGIVDLNFDNILFKQNGKLVIIDYEWVFNFPIPLNYIIFRSLTHFYSSNWQYNPNKIIPLSYLYKHFNISKLDKKSFIKFEYNFQKKIVKKESLPSYKDFTNYYLKLENKIYTETKPSFNRLTIKQLQSSNKNLVSQFKTSQQHSRHLQKDINTLNKTIINFKQTIKETKKHNQHLQKDIDFLNNEIFNLQKTNQSLTQQLKLITSTKSYTFWQKYSSLKKNILNRFNPS